MCFIQYVRSSQTLPSMTALSTDIYSLERVGPSCVLRKVASSFLRYYTIRSHLHGCGHVTFPFFWKLVSHL